MTKEISKLQQLYDNALENYKTLSKQLDAGAQELLRIEGSLRILSEYLEAEKEGTLDEADS